MALTNNQYDTIMREYQSRQSANAKNLDKKLTSIREQIPEFKELEDEASSIRRASLREIISGDKEKLLRTQAKLDSLTARKKEILERHGLSLADLEIKYQCDKCHDKGILSDGSNCSCFKQAAIKLLYNSSHMGDVLDRENFNSYSLEMYDNDKSLADDIMGWTPREYALNAFNNAKNFCDNFDKEFSNIYLYGQPGVGKTFLTNCIAKELMDNCHSVIYLSSSALFEMFSKQTFEGDDEATELVGDIFECDLLIIDDIGTELPNSFTISKFFTCIDERLRRRLSTIISSNLDPVQFMDTYSERIFSRVTSCYNILKLTGDDLRRRNRRN